MTEPCTTSSQETERVYSYNPRACTGPKRQRLRKYMTNNQVCLTAGPMVVVQLADIPSPGTASIVAIWID